MRATFTEKYDFVSEITDFENLFSPHKDVIEAISSTIRNKICKVSNTERLAAILHAYNILYSVVVEMFGDDESFIKMYVMGLKNHAAIYSSENLAGIYDEMIDEIERDSLKKTILEQWKQLNPYLKGEYSDDDFYEKNFIEVFEDMLSNVLKACPEEIFLDMSADNFKHLLRGRAGEFSKRDELAAPPVNLCGLNRWNPEHKRYLYLVAGDGSDNDIETSMAELRNPDGKVTVAYFTYIGDAKDARILDMDYDATPYSEIENETDEFLRQCATEVAQKMQKGDVSLDPATVRQEIEKYDLKRQATIYAAKMILKSISDTIFVPLGDDEDKDQDKKTVCYKSFHILAEFLENKGFAGICFPSTRMQILGKHGRNLVLFNADSAEADENTFRIIER